MTSEKKKMSKREADRLCSSLWGPTGSAARMSSVHKSKRFFVGFVSDDGELVGFCGDSYESAIESSQHDARAVKQQARGTKVTEQDKLLNLAGAK